VLVLEENLKELTAEQQSKTQDSSGDKIEPTEG
jgi:hypothetical protein